MHRNQDGTFNATSTSESLRGEIREDEAYIVRAVVEHKKLKHPSHREWKSDDNDNRGMGNILLATTFTKAWIIIFFLIYSKKQVV